MKLKRITCFALAISILTTTALASVLGSETYSKKQVDVAKGTTYINNVFISDQASVGKQNETYYEYQPNDGIVPVIVNDTYVYGKTKVSQMANKLKQQGMYPIMVMNSDFFSLKTGVQMGNQVVDGVIVTKDSNGQDAVGFRNDGTAFMSWLQIDTTLTVGDNTFKIENINKYPQPYSIYLLTDKFSGTTKSEKPSYNVIIGDLSDNMTINSTITGVVEDIIESDGETEIPKGKIVLCVDKNIASEKMNNIKLLNIGDEVKITNKFEGDARWSECSYIQGSIGGRLIKNGEIQDLDEQAAPRSAIGIKNDGTIIFYTIDGRQSGHSYGLRLKTLSKRLKELGCVDAINFDGGGSTAIVGVYPGYDDITLLNKPSDGRERDVATFIALMNTREATGVADKLHLSPYGGNYLSGTKQKFTVAATDENDFPAKVTGDITFSAGGGSYCLDDGTVVLMGNGDIKVEATNGDIKGSTTVTVFSNPDSIKIYNNKKAIKSLSLSAGETVNLSATAFVESKPLEATADCFEWSVDPVVGSIDKNGVFKANYVTANGNITVKAANKTVTLPVSVTGDKYSAYTEAQFNSDEQNIYITLKSKSGITVDKENISITVDSEPVKFEYSDNVVTVKRDGDYMSKVIIAYTNSMDMRSVKAYTAKGESYKNIFSDITNHWCKDIATYMNNKGVINGVPASDGKIKFNPDMNMTRYEFAVMTANYMDIEVSDFKDVNVDFADSDTIPSWAINQIKVLVSMGIMNGKTYPDGTVAFAGTDNITRAEAIAVIGRVFGENLETKQMDYSDWDSVPSWAKDGFSTLISMGVMSGYDDGTLKPDKKITRAEAVKLIYGVY